MQRLLPYLRTSLKTTVSSTTDSDLLRFFPLKSNTKLKMQYTFIVYEW